MMYIPLPRTYRVAAHTAYVGVGSTFVAIPGTRLHGNDFVERAIMAGAARVVLQRDSAGIDHAACVASRAGVSVDYVACARTALAHYSMYAYGMPHRKMDMIGITGTKGKTTTAMLTAHLLRYTDIPTACITSTGAYINGVHYTTALTTPQPDMLHMLLYYCLLHGVRVVVMEVAAQALTLNRVAGITFDTIILTNISHDHGEFYATHQEYVAAKEQIFAHAHDKTRVFLNADDPTIAYMQPLRGESIWYGFGQTPAQPSRIVSAEHEQLCLTHPTWPTVITNTLYGGANAYNVVSATLCAQQYSVAWSAIAAAHRYFPGAPGRMEEVALRSGAVACLDYAHNAASYRAVLSTLRARFRYVWVVFGASGERDHAKRAPMAATASAYADVVIFTTDNPRSESLDMIMADLYAGVQETCTIHEIRDRVRAIEWACENAPADAVIAVLGKGRDANQTIQGAVYSHSDYHTIQQFA